MKTHQSQTTNGGKTVELDNVAEAIDIGRKWLTDTITEYEAAGDVKYRVTYRVRTDKSSGNPKAKVKTQSAKLLAKRLKERLEKYETCVQNVTEGNPAIKEAIASSVEQLRDLAVEIEPMLAIGYRGYERAEDGVTAAPELVAAGEELCCFQRKRGSDEITKRAGDGAFKVILNTDVSWWGSPADNAGMMGALVLLLQSYGPVEIWIQQGWLGSDPNDGVTLFKLDFHGAFDPTALAFWLSDPDKDRLFSCAINRGLGRDSSTTSTEAEIHADLFLRGDWMTPAGLTQENMATMLHTERLDAMARWVAGTAMQILHPDQQPVIEC